MVPFLHKDNPTYSLLYSEGFFKLRRLHPGTLLLFLWFSVEKAFP